LKKKFNNNKEKTRRREIEAHGRGEGDEFRGDRQRTRSPSYMYVINSQVSIIYPHIRVLYIHKLIL
jgi:hypothetical protein